MEFLLSAGAGVCFTNNDDVACLSDDDNTPKPIATNVDDISSPDASWVYVNANDRFSRLSRTDGHIEPILETRATASVPFGSCVVAVTANGSAMSLWRLAP